jgi:hypothetical protein
MSLDTERPRSAQPAKMADVPERAIGVVKPRLS